MGLATREAYGKALVELGYENENVVVLDADLSKSTKTCDFKKEFPNRFINAGIAEQNLMGMAAGLSYVGKIPFASSFAVFATGRAYEIIRNSICYPNLNVKIAATHAGITVGEDGGTHQSVEDIAIMRALPNMKVFVPCDEEETKQVVKEAAKIKGPVYIRLGRLANDTVFDENYKFEVGKGVVLSKGNFCTVVTTGFTTAESYTIIKELNEEGYDIRHIHMPTLKPIDKNIIIQAAVDTKFILTFEEASTIGGLGEAVSAITSSNYPTHVYNYGLNDEFGQSGTPKDLLKAYKLDRESIKDIITLQIETFLYVLKKC